MMENDDIQQIIDKDLKEHDYSLNGFESRFVAENNEDYEIKLKERLAEFVNMINSCALKKKENLVRDVENICKNVYTAFEAAKEGNIKEAEKLVKDILEYYKKYAFAVSDLDHSYAFRAVAPFPEMHSDYWEKEKYKK